MPRISQKHASKTSNMACMNSYAMISSWYSLDACFWGPAFASDDSLYFTGAALLLWQCSSGMRVSLFLAAKFISSAESSVGKWCSYFETWRFLWNKMRTWHLATIRYNALSWYDSGRVCTVPFVSLRDLTHYLDTCNMMLKVKPCHNE